MSKPFIKKHAISLQLSYLLLNEWNINANLTVYAPGIVNKQNTNTEFEKFKEQLQEQKGRLCAY